MLEIEMGAKFLYRMASNWTLAWSELEFRALGAILCNDFVSRKTISWQVACETAKVDSMDFDVRSGQFWMAAI